MSKKLALYIHYPFCLSKCPYCDFNSHVSDNIEEEEFIKAYEKELDFFYNNISQSQLSSIFFGGGTPSLMSENMLFCILDKINSLWKIDKNCEITLEANPTSFEAGKFANFAKIGINRLSLGIQALNDDDLKFLGRNHSASEAIKTIDQVAKIYQNFSFDLIYARPQQKISNWLKELELAISFGSPHLSLYQLTIEKGTPFFRSFQNKEFKLPNDEEAAELYEQTNLFMNKKGFVNYEISNYAKSHFECRHNLSYWQGDDYIGVGAGAHSRVYFKDSNQRQAIAMLHQPQNWLSNIHKYGNGIQKQYSLTKSEIIEELILTSLRTKEGLTDKILAKHKFANLENIIDLSKLEGLIKMGIVNLKNNCLTINENYQLQTNNIISKICSYIKYDAL